MSEPTYKLCPRCGEPIETEALDAHFLGCDGSIPARCEPVPGPLQGLRREAEANRRYGVSPGTTQANREPIGGDVKEYLDRELPDEHESIADRAERLADRHLRYDGSERGRR